MKSTQHSIKWMLRTSVLSFLLFGLSILSISQTVVDIVVDSDDHETLEAAVIEADLVGTLSGDGPFTVFAPTDAAFELIDSGVLNALLAKPEGSLTDILLYHVLEGDIESSDLSDGMTASTILGEDISVSIVGDDVFINGAMVTVANIPATNGVVHVLDAVLLPEVFPSSVADVVIGSDDHETLEAAVVEADLAATLSGAGAFTVFAPTDDAFAMINSGVLDALIADPSGSLTDILLYHVVDGVVISGDLMDGGTAMSLLGEDLDISLMDGSAFIDGAMVTVADIVTANGVVHVIDAVMLPEVFPTSVAEVVINSDDHETLEAAVIEADLAGTLSGEGAFTVFAPTDAAFAMINSGVLDALLADPSGSLTDILLYHVGGDVITSGELQTE